MSYDTGIAGSDGTMPDLPLERPLEPKIKNREDMTKEEKDEQEQVFRYLAPFYCLCQHRIEAHKDKVGKCSRRVSRMVNGSIQDLECSCLHFTSIQEQAEQTPERTY